MAFAPVPCAEPGCEREILCWFPDDVTDDELLLIVANLRCETCDSRDVDVSSEFL